MLSRAHVWFKGSHAALVEKLPGGCFRLKYSFGKTVSAHARAIWSDVLSRKIPQAVRCHECVRGERRQVPHAASLYSNLAASDEADERVKRVRVLCDSNAGLRNILPTATTTVGRCDRSRLEEQQKRCEPGLIERTVDAFPISMVAPRLPF